MLVNPFTKARLKFSLTQAELAAQVGVSGNFIQRAENGEYPSPPRNLLEFLSGGDLEVEESLSNFYRAYQHESRIESYGLLTEPRTTPVSASDIPIESPIAIHPMLWWLSESNVTLYAVCKAFCVHHSVMHKWVNGSSSSNDFKVLPKKVPKVFLAALFESGYSESTLIDLQGDYETYRRSISSEG